MDVVDLLDLVQLFGHPKNRGKMADRCTKSSLEQPKPSDTASSSSSLSLPMPAHTHDTNNDLEKMATEKSAEAGTAQRATKTVTALDWTGPDDPENPENWSIGKKAFHVAYVGLQCFVVYVE